MRREEIKYIIEAVLFSYAEPITVSELNKIINEELSPKEIKLMLDALIKEYNENDRGIKIIQLEDKYQMCSNEKYFEYIAKIIEPSAKKSLSQATLETVTIIAYKQPITKVEIESIRGVKCDRAISTLVEYGLIKEAGRLERIGRPIIYKTTDELLKLLNINSLDELPSIDQEKQLEFYEETV
ncbi:MAG: SMC-Scp complex subunit ScpB [Clostridioides sp.]|nr:SMC-Scp complex subunit ScpB [Clostridioides sp.]